MSADEQLGGAVSAPTTEGGTAPKVVAYENFQAVVKAKSGLEDAVKDLRAQVQTLTERAAVADTLGAELASWKSKATEAETRYGAFTELSGVLGATDPDVIGLFDAKYRALPEQGRPDRKSWVESLRAAPDEAPSLLRPWLAPAPTAGASAAPRPPAPRVPGTPATPPGAPSSVSPEEIARVREEAVKSGDWSKWRELSVSMGIRPARK